MSSSANSDQLARWHSRPLCCRYVGVFLRTLPIQVMRHGVRSRLELHWAIGWHTESGPEVLGTWLPDGIADVSPLSLIARVHELGIERIGVLIGEGIADLPNRDADGARPPPNALLRPVEFANSVELCSARPADRRRLTAAYGYAGDLEKRLKAALARRGVFSTDAEAMAFLVDYLEREERKIDRLVRMPEFHRDLTLVTRRMDLPRSAPARVRAAPQLH